MVRGASSNMKLFSLFHDSQYTFEGKKDYENVLVLLYRHWFVLFVDVLGFTLLFALPFVIRILFGRFIDNVGLTSLYNFLVVVYLLIWWLSLFYHVTMYLLDTWMVTDHRIIDSEQHGFFKRTVAEAHLSKIEDVAVKVEGLIPTFFDYGNLEIQTAGAQEKIIFKQIPHPNQVRELVMHAQSHFVSTHPNDIEVHEEGLPQ